jgi:hypothetical protein
VWWTTHREYVRCVSRWSVLKSRDVECYILSYLSVADLGALYWCLPRLVVHHLRIVQECTLTAAHVNTDGFATKGPGKSNLSDRRSELLWGITASKRIRAYAEFGQQLATALCDRLRRVYISDVSVSKACYVAAQRMLYRNRATLEDVCDGKGGDMGYLLTCPRLERLVPDFREYRMYPQATKLFTESLAVHKHMRHLHLYAPPHAVVAAVAHTEFWHLQTLEIRSILTLTQVSDCVSRHQHSLQTLVCEVYMPTRAVPYFEGFYARWLRGLYRMLQLPGVRNLQKFELSIVPQLDVFGTLLLGDDYPEDPESERLFGLAVSPHLWLLPHARNLKISITHPHQIFSCPFAQMVVVAPHLETWETRAVDIEFAASGFRNAHALETFVLDAPRFNTTRQKLGGGGANNTSRLDQTPLPERSLMDVFGECEGQRLTVWDWTDVVIQVSLDDVICLLLRWRPPLRVLCLTATLETLASECDATLAISSVSRQARRILELCPLLVTFRLSSRYGKQSDDEIGSDTLVSHFPDDAVDVKSGCSRLCTNIDAGSAPLEMKCLRNLMVPSLGAEFWAQLRLPFAHNLNRASTPALGHLLHAAASSPFLRAAHPDDDTTEAEIVLYRSSSCAVRHLDVPAFAALHVSVITRECGANADALVAALSWYPNLDSLFLEDVDVQCCSRVLELLSDPLRHAPPWRDVTLRSSPTVIRYCPAQLISPEDAAPFIARALAYVAACPRNAVIIDTDHLLPPEFSVFPSDITRARTHGKIIMGTINESRLSGYDELLPKEHDAS